MFRFCLIHNYGKWENFSKRSIYEDSDSKYPYKTVLIQTKTCTKCGKVITRTVKI